jgi:xanthine dehydrogenase/oxidase
LEYCVQKVKQHFQYIFFVYTNFFIQATGEPSTSMSVVVIFALRHALDSARKDSGITDDTFYHLGAPSTTETVFLTANNQPEKFTLS